MPREQYRCPVCGTVKRTEAEMRGHVAALMETNDQYDSDHPHWDELEVSHTDLSDWKETVPGTDD